MDSKRLETNGGFQIRRERILQMMFAYRLGVADSTG